MQIIKEKCRYFLAKLLELSNRERRPIPQSVRTLIQELIDATIEPGEFFNRLERLINARPKPSLIVFLKVKINIEFIRFILFP